MNKSKFLQQLGQTNEHPIMLEIESAKGSYIYTKEKRYLDMIAGVAVNNIGHNHPKVIQAIKEQVDQHMHVMVYGEFVQKSQVEFSETLLNTLPEKLNMVYPVNSGTEANEAALKLAKRVTGRTELIAFSGSYHGSTHGSLSVSGNATKKEGYHPLLPEVKFLEFNNIQALGEISKNTAGVIIETIQGDAGVRIPEVAFMKELRNRCNETGAQLIFDEVQCGVGRTGKMFAFEHFDVIPDILTLGKALGGGMPIGALVSSKENLSQFSVNPALGHITTFGGHPVICSAAKACLDVLDVEIDFDEVERLGAMLQDEISKEADIIEARRIGMMFAFDMESAERVNEVVGKCLEKGLISFWFLSHPNSFRLSPPINISEEEINEAARIIRESIQETAT